MRMSRTAAAFGAVVLFSSLWSSAALSQGTIQQSGSLVAGHALRVVGNGQVMDAGGVDNSTRPSTRLSGLSLVNSGTTDCRYSSYATGPYASMCLGFDGSGNARLSIAGVAGAVPSFTIDFLGIEYGFPFAGTGNVLAPTTPTPTLGQVALFNGGTAVKGGGPLTRSSVLDPSFGALCDGVTNDKTALEAAFAAGVPLSGNNRVCAVSGSVTMPDNLDLAYIEIKQLSAGSATRTLTKSSGSSPVQLSYVTVNMNAAGTVGTVADAAGIWIANADNVVLDHVEVYGGGKGKSILIADGSFITLNQPYIHDMQWAANSDPGIEQIVGLSLQRIVHAQVINPVIKNLTGVIASGAPRAYQTDGIDVGGSQHIAIYGGIVNQVGEGIDTASSELNTDIWLYGTSFVDIDSHGVKFGSISNSGAIGVRVKDAGRNAFNIFASASTPPGGSPTGIKIIGGIAINTGSNGNWPTPAGFRIEYDGGADAPTYISCTDCRAQDGSASMVYGYRDDIGTKWLFPTDPQAVGYTTAFYHNGATDKNLTSGVPPNEPQVVVIGNGGTAVFATPMVTPTASMIIDPSVSPVPAGTLTLPACTAMMFGQVADVVSRATITTPTVNANSGSVSGAPATMLANVGNRYVCRAATWQRFW